MPPPRQWPCTAAMVTAGRSRRSRIAPWKLSSIGADLVGRVVLDRHAGREGALAGAADARRAADRVRAGRGSAIAAPSCCDGRDVQDVERRPVDGQPGGPPVAVWTWTASLRIIRPPDRAGEVVPQRALLRQGDQVLGVPLDAAHPPVPGQLHGLDQAVGRAGHRDQALSQILDGLVVPAVDLRRLARQQVSPRRGVRRAGPPRCGRWRSWARARCASIALGCWTGRSCQREPPRKTLSTWTPRQTPQVGMCAACARRPAGPTPARPARGRSPPSSFEDLLAVARRVDVDRRRRGPARRPAAPARRTASRSSGVTARISSSGTPAARRAST